MPNMRVIAPSTPASMAVLLVGALAAISTGLGASGLKQQLLATAAPTEFVPHVSEKLNCATPRFNEILGARGSTSNAFLPDPLAYAIACSLLSPSIFFVASTPDCFAALASACIDDACSAAANHQILLHPRLPFPRPTVTCNTRGKSETAAPTCSVWPPKLGHGNANVDAGLVQLMPSEGIDATGRHVFDLFSYYIYDISFSLRANDNPVGSMSGFLVDIKDSGVTSRKKSSAGSRFKSGGDCAAYVEPEMHGMDIFVHDVARTTASKSDATQSEFADAAFSTPLSLQATGAVEASSPSNHCTCAPPFQTTPIDIWTEATGRLAVSIQNQLSSGGETSIRSSSTGNYQRGPHFDSNHYYYVSSSRFSGGGTSTQPEVGGFAHVREYHKAVLSGLPWAGYLASTDLSSREGFELGIHLHAFDVTGLVGHSFFSHLRSYQHLLRPVSRSSIYATNTELIGIGGSDFNPCFHENESRPKCSRKAGVAIFKTSDANTASFVLCGVDSNGVSDIVAFWTLASVFRVIFAALLCFCIYFHLLAVTKCSCRPFLHVLRVRSHVCNAPKSREKLNYNSDLSEKMFRPRHRTPHSNSRRYIVLSLPLFLVFSMAPAVPVAGDVGTKSVLPGIGDEDVADTATYKFTSVLHSHLDGVTNTESEGDGNFDSKSTKAEALVGRLKSQDMSSFDLDQNFAPLRHIGITPSMRSSMPRVESTSTTSSNAGVEKVQNLVQGQHLVEESMNDIALILNMDPTVVVAIAQSTGVPEEFVLEMLHNFNEALTRGQEGLDILRSMLRNDALPKLAEVIEAIVANDPAIEADVASAKRRLLSVFGGKRKEDTLGNVFQHRSTSSLLSALKRKKKKCRRKCKRKCSSRRRRRRQKFRKCWRKCKSSCRERYYNNLKKIFASSSSEPPPTKKPSLPPSRQPVLVDSTPPSSVPSESSFVVVEISYRAAIAMENIDANSIPSSSSAEMNKLAEVLASSIINFLPDDSRVRITKIGGVAVNSVSITNQRDTASSGRPRLLQSSVGVGVEFEVIFTIKYNGEESTDAETVSNQLYETVTRDLSQAVDSGDLAAAVRETAETNEVELLSSIALNSFEADEPTCTITDNGGTGADLQCGLPSTNLSDESSSPPSDKSSSRPSMSPSSSPSGRSMGPSSVPSSSPVITESHPPSSAVSGSPSAESGAPSSVPSPLGPSLTPTQCQNDSDCNDGNPCTLDFCSPGSGCVFDALAMDNSPCGGDFNIFSHGDAICQSGVCVGLHYPSTVPSPVPSELPTLEHSGVPSSLPSKDPSSEPSVGPSVIPSGKPSGVPSARPSISMSPSSLPSEIPTLSAEPSSVPTEGPSSFPSVLPSDEPTLSARPSQGPSAVPSLSTRPSSEPTDYVSAICQNIDRQLDSNGSVLIDSSEVDSGSKGGIISLDLNQTFFSCSNVGSNAVKLIATDVNGNTDACHAVVNILDSVFPEVRCRDVTVTLGADGVAVVSASNIDNGSSDSCGIRGLSLNLTSFGCSHLGSNTVELTVVDVNGNQATCAATVTVTGDDPDGDDKPNVCDSDDDNDGLKDVEDPCPLVRDTVAPSAICQNVTIYLDSYGNGATTPMAVDKNSSDPCGIKSMALDRTSFTCADVGTNPVVLTISDSHSNEANCTASIMVEDNIAPNVICDNITISLDASGFASITADQIDYGSSDACGIVELSLDVDSFSLSELGENPVKLTATDRSGNEATCMASVYVADAPSSSPSNTPSVEPSTPPSSVPSLTPSRSPSSLPSTKPSSQPSANPSTSIEISSFQELSDAIGDSQFGSVLAYLTGSDVSCLGSTLIVPGGNTSWVFRLFGPGRISNCTFNVENGAEFYFGDDIELSDVLVVISGHVFVQSLDLEADENVQFVQAANEGGMLTLEDTGVTLSACNDDMSSYQTEYCYRIHDQVFESREAAQAKCEVESDVSLGIFEPSAIDGIFSTFALRTRLWTGARLDPVSERLVWETGETSPMPSSFLWSSIANGEGPLEVFCAIIDKDGSIQATQCNDNSTQYGALCSMAKSSLFVVENEDASRSTNAEWIVAINTQFVLPNLASAGSSIEREIPSNCTHCSMVAVDTSSQPLVEGARQRRRASQNLPYLVGHDFSVGPSIFFSESGGDSLGTGRQLQGSDQSGLDDEISLDEIEANSIEFEDETYAGFVIVLEIEPIVMDDSGLNKNPYSVAVDTVNNARPLERDVSTPGSVFRAAFPGESLPSYVHFHTEIDGISVIRLDVEVLLADLKGGQRAALFSSQILDHFSVCKGDVVCNPTEDDDASCFRAAMVHSDENFGSALLSGLRRDISFNLGAYGCERLVHWTTPQDLHTPYHLEISMNTTHSSFPLRVTALSSQGSIPLSFIKSEADSTKWRAILTRDSFSQLPDSFRFEPHQEADEVGCIAEVDILHYNKRMWSFNSTNVFDCRNVCSPFASSQCLVVSKGSISTLEIDFDPASDSLQNDPSCDQISRIEVDVANQRNISSGEEVCTAPQTRLEDIESLGYFDLQEYLDDTLSLDGWRSVEILVSSDSMNSTNSTATSLLSNSSISVLSRRRIGLVALSDDDSSNTLSNVTFIVNAFAEIRLDGLILSSVKARIDSGTLTLLRNILSGFSDVISTNGYIEVASTRLVDDAQISEEGFGSIVASYSSLDQNATVSTTKGTLSTFSIELQTLPSLGVTEGSNWTDVIELLDAARIYLAVNETNHPACSNDFGGNGTGYIFESDAGTLEECSNRCDGRQKQNDLECSGIHFNSLASSLEERCALCSSSNYALCSSRNCSVGATFYEAIEQVPFVAQSPNLACIADIESKITAVKTDSLVRCQILCHYLQQCEAFTFESAQDDAKDCVLLSRGDFDICPGVGPDVFGIEYKAIEEKAAVIGDFVHISTGICLQVAQYSGFLFDLSVRYVTQCEATCTALVDCLSFVYHESIGLCQFYSHRQVTTCGTASPDDNGDLYVFAGDRFPKFGRNLRKSSSQDVIGDLNVFAADRTGEYSEADGLIDLSCKLTDPFGALVETYTKDWFECRTVCDIKELCKAFTFDNIMGQRKCVLFGQESLGGLFSPTTCSNEGVSTWLGTYILSFGSYENNDINTFEYENNAFPGFQFSDPADEIRAIVASNSQCQTLCSILGSQCDSINFNGTTCTLGFGLEVAKNERDARSSSKSSAAPQDSYFGLGEVCITRDRRLDLGNAVPEGSNLPFNICELFCTVHPKCTAFVHDSTCVLFENIEIALAGCPDARTLYLGDPGLPKRKFLPLPINEAPGASLMHPSLAHRGAPILLDGRTSPSRCEETCAASSRCSAFAFVNSTSCIHYFEPGFRYVDFADTDPTAEIRYSERTYSKYAQSSIDAGGIRGIEGELAVIAPPSLVFCEQICNIVHGCGAISFSNVTSECRLFEEDNAPTTAQDGTLDLIAKPSYPFTALVQSWCPDEGALIMETSAFFEQEECEAFCHHHSDCGFVYLQPTPSSFVCKFYSTAQFAVVDGGCDLPPNSMFRGSYDLKPWPTDFARVNSITIDGAVDEPNSLSWCNELPLRTLNDSSPLSCEASCTIDPACSGYEYDSSLSTCAMYERSLKSNDYPLALYSECSGGSPAATVEPYLIFDNNIYVGDPHQDWCIYDTQSFDAAQKTKEECAALCNAWFDCRAFRASLTDVGDCRLYESAWNRVANCTGDTSLSPLTLFLYKSSYPYTRLDNTFCPASNSPIISLENMSIEACKAACFALEGCFSIKHEGDGDCELYGTTEFSTDCVDTQRDLYISYERFLEQAPDSIAPLYGQCIATVTLVAGQDTEETCEAQCIADPSCRGYALQDGRACHFFDNNVASQLSIEPCNVAGAVVAIKYSTNPYVKAPSACLSEPMPGHRFVDKTYVECMAICEAQSFCRHFSITDVSGRGSGVCQLYLAQVGDIADNCLQSNVTAYINTRSFIDQITWLGIPERIFTAISGISYRECAATCSLLDGCNAFLHDTNRRRSPGFEDELAEPARIISVNFESSSLVPVIWSLDVNDNIVPSIDVTDDDYSDQKIIVETIRGCDEEDSICLVRLRFWFRDLCLVAENQSEISTQPCNIGDAREEWERREDGDNFFFAKQNRCIRTTSTNINLDASCDDPLTRVQFASLPTKLTRDEDVASSSCLSAVSTPAQSGFDMHLEDCQKVDARTSWTYLFGSRQWITVGVSRTISGSETERLYDGYRQQVGTPDLYHLCDHQALS